MNKRIPIAFVITSFVLLTGFHGGCGSSDPAKRAARAERMAVNHVEDALDEIDASDAQTSRILEHTRAVTADALRLHKAHQESKGVLLAEWNADKPDAARVHTLIDTRASEVTKFLHRIADVVIDVHQTLTPAQRKELIDELH